MTEQERIESIKNGNARLASFKKENITYAMCLAAVEKDGASIYAVPEEFRTKEVYQLAAQTYSNVVQFMPEQYRTKKVWEDVVKVDWMMLSKVPEKWVSEKLCLDAICQEPQAFQFVPEDMMTAEFCVKAIKRAGNLEVLQSLPEKKKSTAFYMELLDKYPKVFSIIPKKYRTAAVCKKAIEKLNIKSVSDVVRKDPSFFALLHPALYDHDTCMAFVQSKQFSQISTSSYAINDGTISDNGFIIPLERFLQFPDVAKIAVSHWTGYFAYVPAKAMTPELCKMAVEENAMALEHVPDSLQSEKICEIAVRGNGRVIRCIPEKKLTSQLCKLAVENDSKSIELIPEKWRTKDLLELAFTNYPQCIELFPDEYKTESLCLQAVSSDGELLKSVPETLRTYDICYAAAIHGADIKDIPENLIDKKIALAIIEHGTIKERWEVILNDTIPLLFAKVPDSEVYLAAVKKKGESLKYVPDEAKSYEMCLAAIHSTLSAVSYIPDDMFTDEIRSIYAKNWVPWVGEMDIPEKHQTSQMWLEIFNRHDCCVHYVLCQVPKGLLNQEMCDVMVRNSYPLYRKIPEEFISEDMIIYMAKTTPGQLGLRFPEELKTEAFCKRLIEINPVVEEYI